MPLRIGPFYLGKPTDADVNKLVEECPRWAFTPCMLRKFPNFISSTPAFCRLPFNFPHVTVTKSGPPLKAELSREGWAVDHNRVQVS